MHNRQLIYRLCLFLRSVLVAIWQACCFHLESNFRGRPDSRRGCSGQLPDGLDSVDCTKSHLIDQSDGSTAVNFPFPSNSNIHIRWSAGGRKPLCCALMVKCWASAPATETSKAPDIDRKDLCWLMSAMSMMFELASSVMAKHMHIHGSSSFLSWVLISTVWNPGSLSLFDMIDKGVIISAATSLPEAHNHPTHRMKEMEGAPVAPVPCQA